MPEFSTPYNGKKLDRKLTQEELIRTIRFSIAAEFEAIQLYEQIAETTDNEQVKEIMLDIADEEKVHVGEFLHILKSVSPDDEKFYDEGEKEAKEHLT